MNMKKSVILPLLASPKIQAFSMITLGFLTVSALFNNCAKIDGTKDESSLNLGPAPIITSSLTSPTTSTPMSLTISFDRDVVGLAVEDFVVTNGTASGLDTISARNYTLDITATAWGLVTVVLPAGVARDISSGQASAGSNTFTITFGSNDANAFSVGIIEDNKYPYYFGRDGGAFGGSCSILATSLSSNNITCTLDLNEGDAWFWGYKFKYQAPPGMCKYLAFYNYYFYNFEVGYGPTAITVYKQDNLPFLSAVVAPNTAPVFANLPAACVGAGIATCCVVEDAAHMGPNAQVYPNCVGIPEVKAISPEGKPTCKYDYTDNDGPNCCAGNYDLVINQTIKNATTNVITAAPGASERLPWDGKFGDCMGGPAADDTDWPKAIGSGVPAGAIVQYAADGLNETYEVRAPNTTSFAVPINISAINYHINSPGVTTPHAHTVGRWNGTALPLVDVASNLPFAIEPIADRSGDGLSSANSDYVFDCLDGAFEVKHRMRVKAREWNTYAAYLAYGATSGATVNPDVVGADGTACSEAGSILVSGGYCNDNMDWDDFFPINVGNTPIFQTPRAGYTGDRYYYFPRVPREISAPTSQ